MLSDTGAVDLHLHTTVSDGTDTPEELLTAVRRAGFSVFSATDHDAVKAGLLLRSCLRPGDPAFIQGAEFACRDEKGKYHVLGYGFDPEHPAVQELVGRTHALRIRKVVARLDFLKTTFGFTFPQEEISRLLSLDNPGKPHIGRLMVRYGYAGTVEQAMKEYINRIRFANEYARPQEVVGAILAGGGIPVLAHPFYGNGDEWIYGEEMENRLRHLIGLGLRGIEAFYSGFSPAHRREALALAKRFDLYVTAGSDYHGTNKLVLLGDTGLPDVQEYPEGLRRFLETVRYETP